MQVKYIGDHVKTDSFPGVGLRWEPGQVRDVTSTVAAHLLKYPDTWVKGDAESDKDVPESQRESRVEAGDKPEPIGYMEEDRLHDEPIPVVNFHAMDKEALLKYAADNFNERFPHNISEDVLRERVTKLHTDHEIDRQDREKQKRTRKTHS